MTAPGSRGDLGSQLAQLDAEWGHLWDAEHPLWTASEEASRRDLVAVIEEIQALVSEGVVADVGDTATHVMPSGETDHFPGWDCYCVPEWVDRSGTRTYLHHDVNYWADR